MKLKDIISSASEILGLGGEEDAILLRCANLVAATVAANYISCAYTQDFENPTGKIDYKEFEKPPIRIRAVKKGGAVVAHKTFLGYLRVPFGRITIDYDFIPRYEDTEDEVAFPGLSAEGFTYGVLAEYAFLSGMFNEAKVWNEKFQNHLFAAQKQIKRLTLPAPKW